jgi:hypothetical protein
MSVSRNDQQDRVRVSRPNDGHGLGPSVRSIAERRTIEEQEAPNIVSLSAEAAEALE